MLLNDSVMLIDSTAVFKIGSSDVLVMIDAFVNEFDS